MEYKLITHTDVLVLQNQINEYLKDGWKLYGYTNAVSKEKWSLQLQRVGHTVIYYQALIKE